MSFLCTCLAPHPFCLHSFQFHITSFLCLCVCVYIFHACAVLSIDLCLSLVCLSFVHVPPLPHSGYFLGFVIRIFSVWCFLVNHSYISEPCGKHTCCLVYEAPAVPTRYLGLSSPVSSSVAQDLLEFFPSPALASFLPASSQKDSISSFSYSLSLNLVDCHYGLIRLKDL